MSLWTSLGFAGNPYDTRPLKANKEGANLLAGRDRESRLLLSKLRNTNLHPTLEGANGVGKTSLVLVNVFRAQQETVRGDEKQLLLPIKSVVQMRADVDRLHHEALLAIVQTLIENKDLLREQGYKTADLSALEDWINNPVVKSGGGGAQVLGFGGNADVSREVNTSEGFLDSGLEVMVRRALEQTFPSDSAGMLVGVIDNVELLSLSNEARSVLVKARDRTLDLPRVRWVLCGALGIVRSCVSSPALGGRLARPIEVAPVAPESIGTLIGTRLQYFGGNDADRAPVGAREFKHIYRICNENLRDAFKYAQDFCVWLEAEDEIRDDANYLELLEVWLARESEEIMQSLTLQPRAWRLFDDLAAAGGSCAPSDNFKFGFKTPQQMRTCFAALERVSLIKAEVDEGDLRRRTVNVTDKGWLVRYARSGFPAPEA